MKIINYIKIVIITYLIFFIQITNAQNIGVNTSVPTATLDVLSKGNSEQTKNIQITNFKNVNLMTLLDNGYMGLGTANPIVPLDLRGGADQNNVIGIGDTDLDAISAKGGALKYDSQKNELQYSDGTQWMVLEANTVRGCLIANNSYNVVNCPNNTTTKLTTWDIIYDTTGKFNTSTGIFTAPRDGLYTATFTIHMAIASVQAGSYIEGQWVSSNGITIKCSNSFPVAGAFMAYITCSGTVYLKAGDTLYPQIFHNTGNTLHPRVYGDTPNNPTSDTNFNNLSIVIE